MGKIKFHHLEDSTVENVIVKNLQSSDVDDCSRLESVLSSRPLSSYPSCSKNPTAASQSQNKTKLKKLSLDDNIGIYCVPNREIRFYGKLSLWISKRKTIE